MNAKDDNCKDMKELISAYRDAELDANEHRRVEEHLASCSDCRNELAAVESAVQSLKTLSPVRLSVDFADDIEAILKRAEAGAVKPDGEAVSAGSAASTPSTGGAKVIPFQRKSNRKMWLAAAAAVTVSLVAAAYFGTTGGVPPIVADKPDAIVKPVGEQQKQEIANSNIEQATVDANDEASNVENTALEVATTNGVSNDVEKEHVNGQAPVVKAPTTSKDETVIAQAPKISKPTRASVDNRSARSDVFVDDLSDNEALVALSDTYDDGDIFDGISTDEDGLYAIKM